MAGMDRNIERILQDCNLHRHVDSLIVAHLRDNKLNQAVFSHTEEFILSIDEPQNEIVVWDALTATEATRLWSKHMGPPLWIEHSPVEAAFASCGNDRSVRFWKEVM